MKERLLKGARGVGPSKDLASKAFEGQTFMSKHGLFFALQARQKKAGAIHFLRDFEFFYLSFALSRTRQKIGRPLTGERLKK